MYVLYYCKEPITASDIDAIEISLLSLLLDSVNASCFQKPLSRET